ncbi:hypothetical protein NQD34_001664 [Periophthalmus magnuspinnatus]|nr:hypothetical protein NQD34_001664 [Periophthalmus magnuspinnatus]
MSPFWTKKTGPEVKHLYFRTFTHPLVLLKLLLRRLYVASVISMASASYSKSSSNLLLYTDSCDLLPGVSMRPCVLWSLSLSRDSGGERGGFGDTSKVFTESGSLLRRNNTFTMGC